MARTLADLERAGLLQAKPVDRQRVSRWSGRSRKDLDLARDILAGIDRDRAMAVAYEAGYRACASVLDWPATASRASRDTTGLAIDGVTVVLGTQHRALLRRLDRARRFRNDSLYGDVATAGRAEFNQLLKDVDWLLTELASRLDQEV